MHLRVDETRGNTSLPDASSTSSSAAGTRPDSTAGITPAAIRTSAARTPAVVTTLPPCTNIVVMVALVLCVGSWLRKSASHVCRSQGAVDAGLVGGQVEETQRRSQRWVVLAVSTNMPAATRLATGADV
ncbi:MAG: hypothetical protein AAF628_34855, partial [Planctomycetota bacterium]